VFRSPFMNSVASSTRVLIVGADRALRARLMRVVARIAHVEGCRSFKAARARLAASPYDLLVTDARLAEYSGIHLVYVAKLAHPATRAVVYDRDGDLEIAAVVHRAGAFFEVAPRLLVTLPSYVAAPLPAADRRKATIFDRRLLPRGGRRLGDRQVVRSAIASASPAHY
jgi:DNA-binding NtrC family response regulator